jgi:hypothetical protein
MITQESASEEFLEFLEEWLRPEPTNSWCSRIVTLQDDIVIEMCPLVASRGKLWGTPPAAMTAVPTSEGRAPVSTQNVLKAANSGGSCVSDVAD